MTAAASNMLFCNGEKLKLLQRLKCGMYFFQYDLSLTHNALHRGYLVDYSTNGTFVNDKAVQPRVPIELKEGDALKFAFSTRQYVLHEEKIKL